MAFQPGVPTLNVSQSDLGMLQYYAEQSAIHARNNPMNVIAQQQAQHFAEQLAAAQRAAQLAQVQAQLQGMQQFAQPQPFMPGQAQAAQPPWGAAPQPVPATAPTSPVMLFNPQRSTDTNAVH